MVQVSSFTSTSDAARVCFARHFVLMLLFLIFTTAASLGVDSSVEQWLSKVFGQSDDSVRSLEEFLQRHGQATVDLVQFAEKDVTENHCQKVMPDVWTAPPMLWHLAESLQRCGVKALPTEWLFDEHQWEGLQQEASHYLGALADVRSDETSVICRHFRQGKMEANDTDSKGRLRCPRCGKAVGQAKDMQSRLQVFYHDLDKTSSGAQERESSLIESTAACREVVEVHQPRFQEVQSSMAAMLAELESLECNSCEVQAFASVDLLWSALALLQCAPYLDESPALLEPKLQRAMEVLESNLWKGVGFPSLHEAVSKGIFQLRRSRRFQNFESSRSCASKSLLSLLVGEGRKESWEEEEQMMLAKGQKPMDISIGYFHLAHRLMATKTSAAQQAVPQALALAGAWLRQVEGTAAAQAAQLLAEAAFRLAMLTLSPGLQVVVLETGLQALHPFKSRPLHMHKEVFSQLKQLRSQMPVVLPASTTLVQMRLIAPFVDRLHSSFARLLQTVSLQAGIFRRQNILKIDNMRSMFSVETIPKSKLLALEDAD